MGGLSLGLIYLGCILLAAGVSTTPHYLGCILLAAGISTTPHCHSGNLWAWISGLGTNFGWLQDVNIIRPNVQW